MIREIKRVVKKVLAYSRVRYATVLTYGSIRLYIDRSIISVSIIRRIVKGKYESNEKKIIARHLTVDDRVIELGTGMGFISLYCSLICPPENIYTYEANPLLLPLIKKNYNLNNRYPLVENCILLNNPNTPFSDFFICHDFYSSSLTQPDVYKEIIKVPNRDFVEELKRIRPTFLIVDIEGYEYELFKDIQTLEGISKVLIELHPEKAFTHFDLVGHLQGIGFVVEQEYLSVNQLFAIRHVSL